MNLSGCDKLDTVQCLDSSVLNSIDLSNCSSLREIFIDSDKDSNLSELYINGCPEIADFRLWGSVIQELDISDCPHLIAATEQELQENSALDLLSYECEEGYIQCNSQIVLIK